jgi:hypothetical protein
LYKDDLYKNPFANNPLVQVAVVQQHVIPEIRACISGRVGRVSERDQHVISSIATLVRRLTVSQQKDKGVKLLESCHFVYILFNVVKSRARYSIDSRESRHPCFAIRKSSYNIEEEHVDSRRLDRLRVFDPRNAVSRRLLSLRRILSANLES